MFRRHRAMLLSGIAAFLAYAYFYQAGGWNQNTRFDLVRALVEERGIRIDDYQENTGDRAVFDGHYYADKAPGASFTAAPVVAIARAAMHEAGANVRSHRSLMWLSYVASLAASALPAAIAVMLVWWMARAIGATEVGSTVVALAFGLATPFWAWATVFYSHTLGAMCLLGAFAPVVRREVGETTASSDTRVGLLIGVLIGWAVVAEFPTVIPGAVVVLAAIGQAWRQGGAARATRLAAAVAIGGGLCAVLLGAYHYSAFGSPFHVGYKSEEDSSLLQNGFFGLTYPKLNIVRELLWGSFRGLLPHAPALALAPIGWILAARRPVERRVVLIAGVVFLAGLAWNAAYEHWEGGWSFGPRHLGPVLGFLALGLVPVWTHGGRVLRGLVLALLVCGAAVNLVGVATDAQPPNDYTRPMAEYLWPSFKDGYVSLNRQSYFDKRPPERTEEPRNIRVVLAQWNLGEQMGLVGLWSLLPLGIALGVTIGFGLATGYRE
jgi:hypothetical protein